MPYNGSGVFSRVYNWQTDKNNSVNITASRMDTETDGIATGLSSCLLKDGTQTVTANIPFSSFKITGLGSGTAATDAANVGQLQSQLFTWIAGGGTADVITATYSPAVTSLVDGMELDFRATAANATTTPTFSPSGLTAHTITQNGGSALVAGSIPAALFEAKLRYNLANTRWELMNPFQATIPFVDTSAIVKGSGDATKLLRFEVDGFTTGTTRVMTPPNFDGTLATLAGSETFTNKTLTTPTVNQPNIVGTTTNDSAAAGSVGEYIESVVTFASPTTTFVNVTDKNVTSISLTAGDWDVFGHVTTVPAGSTTTSTVKSGINTTTNTLPAAELRFQGDANSTGAGLSTTTICPPRRISVAGTTTVYLVTQVGFAVSTMSCCGIIWARRRR